PARRRWCAGSRSCASCRRAVADPLTLALHFLIRGGWIVLAGGGVVFDLIRARHKRRHQQWRGAAGAEACGLAGSAEYRVLGFLKGLEASAGALSVRFETHQRRRNEYGTRILVRGVAPTLALRGEGLGNAIARRRGGGDLELGDPAFDRQIEVRAPRLLAFALLDTATRRAVRQIFAGV